MDVVQLFLQKLAKFVEAGRPHPSHELNILQCRYRSKLQVHFFTFSRVFSASLRDKYNFFAEDFTCTGFANESSLEMHSSATQILLIVQVIGISSRFQNFTVTIVALVKR